ncbi:MAG: hypothetical protein AB2556_25300, partial [Candidatus Thiodiazotropha sp.]
MGMLTARIFLNGSSGYKELTQYQIELSPGFLLQGYVPVAYLLVHRPDRFLFRFEPLSHSICREWGFFCLCGFWPNEPCS